MTVPAWLIAIVRSLVQAGVSALVSAAWFVDLTDWLATNMNIELTATQIEQAAFSVVFVLIVGLTNRLGKLDAFQWLNQVISLGLSNSVAVYEKTAVAGGDQHPDVGVDTGGEDMGLEKGAISLATVLVVAAAILAVAVLFGASGPLLAIAVLCLAAAHLVGGVNVA